MIFAIHPIRTIADSMRNVGQFGGQSDESIAYNMHHFACPECQAAGRLQPGANRCSVGRPLWAAYVDSFAAGAEGGPACGEGSAPKATPHGNYGGNVSEASAGATK